MASPEWIDVSGRFLRDLDVVINRSPDALPEHALKELRQLAPRLSNDDWLRLLMLARSLALITSMTDSAAPVEAQG